MICSRFDYYSPYVLFLCALRLELCGCVCGPTLHFCHKPFSPLSDFLRSYLLSLCFRSKKCGRIRFKCVYLCFHAVLVGQKVQQGVFHVKKMLARAFSGWFSSVRLRQGQVEG